MIKLDWAKIWDRIERISGMPVQKMWNVCLLFAVFILGISLVFTLDSNNKLRDKIGDVREEYNQKLIAFILERQKKDEEEARERLNLVKQKEKQLDSTIDVLDKTYKSLQK